MFAIGKGWLQPPQNSVLFPFVALENFGRNLKKYLNDFCHFPVFNIVPLSKHMTENGEKIEQLILLGIPAEQASELLERVEVFRRAAQLFFGGGEQESDGGSVYEGGEQKRGSVFGGGEQASELLERVEVFRRAAQLFFGGGEQESDDDDDDEYITEAIKIMSVYPTITLEEAKGIVVEAGDTADDHLYGQPDYYSQFNDVYQSIIVELAIRLVQSKMSSDEEIHRYKIGDLVKIKRKKGSDGSCQHQVIKTNIDGTYDVRRVRKNGTLGRIKPNRTVLQADVVADGGDDENVSLDDLRAAAYRTQEALHDVVTDGSGGEYKTMEREEFSAARSSDFGRHALEDAVSRGDMISALSIKISYIKEQVAWAREMQENLPEKSMELYIRAFTNAAFAYLKHQMRDYFSGQSQARGPMLLRSSSDDTSRVPVLLRTASL